MSGSNFAICWAPHGISASALATGHYVRRVTGPDGPELHRAADMTRDQSYFLFATTRAELDFLRFPLGGLAKDETRALARRFGLPVADKPDSQDICFVPQGSYARLVEGCGRKRVSPGDIVDMAGRVLGRHRGIAHFTVGQRKGLGIAAAEPLYVLRIEPEQRRVVVGPRAALAETRLSLWRSQLAAARLPCRVWRVAAKLRSAQPPVPAMLLSRRHQRRGRAGSRRSGRRGRPGPSRRALRRRAGARRRLDPAASGGRGLTGCSPSPICGRLAAG